MSMEGTSFGETIAADENTLTKSAGTMSVKDDGITPTQILSSTTTILPFLCEAYALSKYLYVRNLVGASGYYTVTANKKLLYYTAMKTDGFLFRSPTVITGTWGLTDNASSHPIGGYYSNTAAAAINDGFSFLIYCPTTGNYTLNMRHVKSLGFGIATVYIDNVSQGTVDAYQAGGGWVYDFTSSVNLTGLTAGEHTLKIVVTSKNASATAYNFLIQEILIEQA